MLLLVIVMDCFIAKMCLYSQNWVTVNFRDLKRLEHRILGWKVLIQTFIKTFTCLGEKM